MEYCPVTVPDPFNLGLSSSKAIHIYFSQAIPLITYIDEECLYLKEKKCRICEGVCENGAIDFDQTSQRLEVNVGAIVLALGYKPFDPKVSGRYGYGRLRNVVTSLEFERLLSSTGPYEGKILRPSDQKSPRKIAWVQCVGSRRVSPNDNIYCSSVCCTYTQKQVILTKLHNPEAECTIFHNDIRSYGKDYERFYDRARRLDGVRFIRSYVSIDRENPKNGNVVVRYSSFKGGVEEEEFDLVVLSVGLTPPHNSEELAALLGVELNSYGFCKTRINAPVETSRHGIFICGAFHGPSDIPESIFTASGAASKVGELLHYRRRRLTRRREYPPEENLSGQRPRIGVFVCHCGANIGRVVDVPSTVEYALKLPSVVHSQEQLFSCSTNSVREIIDVIREKRLNRVVIAACSPLTHEPLFRDTLREAGINQYYLEMANIREHNSWVHSKEPEEATEKAKNLIRMAVARAHHLKPLQELELQLNKAVLIVGGGIAGMTCALSVANQNHEVYIIEKEPELGGMARRLFYTIENLDVQSYLKDIIRKVYQHPLIHIYTDATIIEVTGYIGNFLTRVESHNRLVEIRHGATVIATGAQEYRPTEYLYGRSDSVLTQLELEERIAKKEPSILSVKTLVMIQCVGCRNEERNYCARVCCSQAVKNALKLRELNPETDIYILFRDIRTYGLLEAYYKEASDKDVKFIRYEPDNRPQVEPVEEQGEKRLRVTLPDYVLRRKVAIDADMLVLSVAVVPSKENERLSQLFKVTLDEDGFFKEAHVKLRPVEFGTDGVYLCGMAHYPKHISETIRQSYGAAGRVLALLAYDTIKVSGSVCEVDEKRCIGCGICVSVCAYGAIELSETEEGRKAVINPVLCKGDGLCNARCPTGAVSLKHYTNEQFISQIDTAFEPSQQLLSETETADLGVEKR